MAFSFLFIFYISLRSMVPFVFAAVVGRFEAFSLRNAFCESERVIFAAVKIF